mgnify:CR=1 FL=1
MANAVDYKQYGGSILEAFLPKKPVERSSTTSQTTKTDVSQAGIDEIIRGMMESDSGLAALLTKQSGAGLYNSSTSQLLANDLAARTAGKAAVASAPTTQTQTQTTKEPGNSIDPKWLLGLQLVGELFGGGSGSGSSSKPGRIDLTSAMDTVGGWLGFGKDDEEDNTDFNFNAADNYSGFGFGADNFSDFSLGYSPVTYSGGSSNYDFTSGIGYQGSTLNSTDYGYTPANYSLAANYGGDYAGLSFGFSF